MTVVRTYILQSLHFVNHAAIRPVQFIEIGLYCFSSLFVQYSYIFIDTWGDELNSGQGFALATMEILTFFISPPESLAIITHRLDGHR